MQVLISIILLILVLGIIIFVHELGHLAVAKWCGIRVDEFGMGFPPRAWKMFSYKGTDYTLNWIPFGGFVKIYGEDSLDKDDPDYQRSLMAKPWWQQIAVLLAGVTMNVLLAWVIFTGMFTLGAPTLASQTQNPELLSDVQLTVLDVASQSPASEAGITSGDVITKALGTHSILVKPSASAFINFVQTSSDGIPVTITVQKKDGTTSDVVVTPRSGIISDKVAVGVAVDDVGYQKLPFGKSITQGFTTTIGVIKGTATAFKDLITGSLNFSSVSGPVGLTKVVGEAQQVGAASVFVLIAVISVNLAIINIMPFPALDGGRILFVIIETVIRRPLPKKFVEYVNGAGFLILIALMLIITAKDIFKLF